MNKTNNSDLVVGNFYGKIYCLLLSYSTIPLGYHMNVTLFRYSCSFPLGNQSCAFFRRLMSF